jgi:UDP-N-acetylmuramate: L-alanyl-gamma-D-glutamyl-meso-diaminopimelate ligase
LIDDVCKNGNPAVALPDCDAIVEHLLTQLRDGDVVAIMSNGGFGGIHEKLLAVLKQTAMAVGKRKPE